MNKVLLCLIVVFSLLLAPITHAGETNNKGDGCQMSELAKKGFTKEKQDDGKLAKAGHHCCCTHASIKGDLFSHSSPSFTYRTTAIREDDCMTSIVVGPPLEPPSHA